MGKPTITAIEADKQAAIGLLEHAFRNVNPFALRDVDFADIAIAFAEHRATAVSELAKVLIDLRSSHDTEAGRFAARYAADRAIAKATGAAE